MSMGLKPDKIFISKQFYVFKTTYALLCYSLKTTYCVWLNICLICDYVRSELRYVIGKHLHENITQMSLVVMTVTVL